MLGVGEFGQQPLHFVLLERHVDLDRRMAGDRRCDPRAHRFQIDDLVFARELLEDFIQHVLDLRSVHARRCDFHRDAACAERFRFEAVVR